MSEKAAASQNAVEPPLPSTTSYPSGSRNSSEIPLRTRPTSDFTGFCRWEVPSSSALACRWASCSGRTLDGPQPKRPSAGRRCGGITMSGTPTSLLSLRLGWDRRAREATMTDLVDTTEMYLRTILDLEEEGIVPLRARISERLGHSGPTVSQTIGRMERDGLVVVEGDRHLVLTV